MNTTKQAPVRELEPHLPSLEKLQQELGSAKSIDDFFGKDGIFARLFADTLETMLEAELTAHLGYEPYEAKGTQGVPDSGNSRNGKRPKQLRTSAGDTEVQIPRDRNGEFSSQLLAKRQTSTNELEEKILAMYGKGMSTRDIQSLLGETYGIEVSADTISAITDKVWPLVEAWQNRPLAAIYPIIYLDGFHVKLRRQSKVENVAVYIVLGVDLEGHRDVLGHWLGDGAEGANFWLSVITDLQARGVEDIFIACIDGLTGFKDAIHAIFPKTEIQRCIIHQIRHSLQYVAWKDRKAFVADLKQVYQASTREEAESHLLQLGEIWGKKYAIAVKSWENNWEDLATFFNYPTEIRRLIYTTNAIEGYNRGLRKVVKTKSSFPASEAVRKLLYLANQNITNKWTVPIQNWAHILNQLAIRFTGRYPL